MFIIDVVLIKNYVVDGFLGWLVEKNDIWLGGGEVIVVDVGLVVLLVMCVLRDVEILVGWIIVRFLLEVFNILNDILVFNVVVK